MNENESSSTNNSLTPANHEEFADQASIPRQSKTKKLVLSILRRVLGFLIIGGIGFLVALFTLFVPTRQAIQQAQRQLASSNQMIEKLSEQVVELDAMKVQLQAAQAELDEVDFHLSIKSAQLDIANAQLAMLQEEPEKAKLALSQTADTLNTIKKQLPTDQAKISDDMQTRLNLVLSEIDTNPYAATLDLEVLATSLLELESIFF